MNTTSHKRLAFATKALLTIGMLVAIIVYADAEKMVASWKRADGRYAMLAAVLVLPNIFLQTLSWWTALRVIDKSVSLVQAARMVVVGTAMGAATPGRVGDVAMVALLNQAHRLSAAGLFVVVRAISGAGLFVAGWLALISSPSILSGVGDGHGVFVRGLVVMAALVTAALLAIYVRHKLSGQIPLRGVWGSVRKGTSGIRLLGRGDLVKIALYSLVVSLVVAVQLGCLARVFGEVGSLDSIIAAAITMALQALAPIGLGNLGIRESAAALCFSRVGLPPAAAVNAALSLFAVNIVIPGLVGTLAFWRKSKSGPMPEEPLES